MCHTQTLDLRFNQIGDQGVTALAEACAGGALPSLRSLDLQCNAIGDVGLSALASTCAGGAQLPQLKELYLYSNNIGDTGCAALAEACVGGAMAQLKVSSRLTALDSCLESQHACSPGLTDLFDVSYVPCAGA